MEESVGRLAAVTKMLAFLYFTILYTGVNAFSFPFVFFNN